MAQKLTPKPAKALLLSLFNERNTWAKGDLAAAVERLHADQGGIPGTQDVKAVVKKALVDLRKQGRIRIIGKGLWTSGQSSIPLQPVYAREPILQLLRQREAWKRSDLIKSLTENHLAAGHELGTQPAELVVKKALEYLKDAGLAYSPREGFWAIKPSSDGASDEVAQTPEVVDHIATDLSLIELAKKGCVVLGSGTEAVYLYYYDNDRKDSLREGRTTWHCKIGYAQGNVEERVRAQAKTARALPPVIAVVIRTDSCVYLERVIHNTLKMLDRQVFVDGWSGHEWFDTNPDQLIAWWNSYVSTHDHFLR
jgi:hypothetical protein